MSKAAVSSFVHGLYALSGGLSFFLAPGMVLSILGFPPGGELWCRVFGLEVAVLGMFYLVGARKEQLAFIKASIFGRIGFTALLGVPVAMGIAPVNLLLLGVPDFITAIWTSLAFRAMQMEQKS